MLITGLLIIFFSQLVSYISYVFQLISFSKNNYFIYNGTIFLTGLIFYFTSIRYFRSIKKNKFNITPEIIFRLKEVSFILFVISVIFAKEFQNPIVFIFVLSSAHFMGISFVAIAFFTKNRKFITKIIENNGSYNFRHIMQFPIWGYSVSKVYDYDFRAEDKLTFVILRLKNTKFRLPFSYEFTFQFISMEALDRLSSLTDGNPILREFIIYFLLPNNTKGSSNTAILFRGALNAKEVSKSLQEINQILQVKTLILDKHIFVSKAFFRMQMTINKL